MQLRDLLSHLPAMDGPISAPAHGYTSLSLDPEAVPGYVPPTFTVSDWPEGASVLLIEAAGAVGKSAAAREIASELNWPLVRAEQAQVGSYSLSGLIQDALGFGSTFIADVANGVAGVVIDSLDEAHFRAGTENFLAFLENVWKVAGASAPPSDRPPSVILMSRSDTAELVRLAFADADVRLACASIDFFDRLGARKFIDAYLNQRSVETKRPEYNAPRAHPVAFEKLRDGRLKQIAAVLSRNPAVDLQESWDTVDDFLGYTPVLIAMAESLAVTNPWAQEKELAAQDQSNLLREIIDNILVREQGKLSQHLQPKLQSLLPPSSESDVLAGSLYQPAEQAARILAYLRGEELATDLPGVLPASVRTVYDEAVRTFLPEHPFLRNRAFASVVFGDYIMAAACRSHELGAALEARPVTYVENVGPFFTRFLADGIQPGELAVPESLAEAIVESWNLEADLVRSQDSEVLITLAEGHSFMMCGREAQQGHNEPPELEFMVDDVSGAFHVSRPLRRTTIVTDQGVIVGRAGQQLLLGPRTILMAGEVVIEAETLRVDTERGSRAGVIIAADTVSANYLNKVEADIGDLHVFTTDPPARLREYARALTVGSSVIPYQRYLDLRTILTAFRPGGPGTLAVLAAKIDNKIVKANQERARILAHLTNIGAVTASGVMYHLDLAVLGQHGFGLQDLKTGQPTEAVLSFLHNCGPASG